MVRKSPSGHVIRLVRRSFGKLPEVRIVLHREQLPDEVAVGLIHGDDPGLCGNGTSLELDVLPKLVYQDTVEGQAAQEFHGCHRVALVLRYEVGVRRSFSIRRNDVSPRLIAIIQDVRLVLRRHIEHRDARRQHVVHGVTQPPPTAGPRTRVQGLGAEIARTFREVTYGIEVRGRVAIEACLREERGNVVEVIGVVHEPRVPVVETGAHVHGALLTTFLQRLGHRHADQVHRSPHEGVDELGDGFGERGDPDSGGKRRCLVVVVHDLRFPIPQNPSDNPRLDHVEHVAITIVVVADVALVQAWHGSDFVRRSQVGPIPLRYHGLTVGVD